MLKKYLFTDWVNAWIFRSTPAPLSEVAMEGDVARDSGVLVSTRYINNYRCNVECESVLTNATRFASVYIYGFRFPDFPSDTSSGAFNYVNGRAPRISVSLSFSFSRAHSSYISLAESSKWLGTKSHFYRLQLYLFSPRQFSARRYDEKCLDFVCSPHGLLLLVSPLSILFLLFARDDMENSTGQRGGGVLRYH